MYTSICRYLRVLPVLHRQEVVDIGVNTIKHLGIDSSTDQLVNASTDHANMERLTSR